jgi:hypothetical protein
MKRSTGQVLRIGSGEDAYRAFVPAPLPPDPPLKFKAADHDLIERANKQRPRHLAAAALAPAPAPPRGSPRA